MCTFNNKSIQFLNTFLDYLFNFQLQYFNQFRKGNSSQARLGRVVFKNVKNSED